MGILKTLLYGTAAIWGTKEFAQLYNEHWEGGNPDTVAAGLARSAGLVWENGTWVAGKGLHATTDGVQKFANYVAARNNEPEFSKEKDTAAGIFFDAPVLKADKEFSLLTRNETLRPLSDDKNIPQDKRLSKDVFTKYVNGLNAVKQEDIDKIGKDAKTDEEKAKAENDKIDFRAEKIGEAAKQAVKDLSEEDKKKYLEQMHQSMLQLSISSEAAQDSNSNFARSIWLATATLNRLQDNPNEDVAAFVKAGHGRVMGQYDGWKSDHPDGELSKNISPSTLFETADQKSAAWAQEGKKLEAFMANPNATRLDIGHGSTGFMFVRNGAGGVMAFKGDYSGDRVIPDKDPPVLLSNNQITDFREGVIRQLETASNPPVSITNYLIGHAKDNPLSAGSSASAYGANTMNQPLGQGMQGSGQSHQAERAQQVNAAVLNMNYGNKFDAKLRNNYTFELPDNVRTVSGTTYQDAKLMIQRTGQDEYNVMFTSYRNGEVFRTGPVQTNGEVVRGILNPYAGANDDWAAMNGLINAGENPDAWHKVMSDTYKPATSNTAPPAQPTKADYRNQITPPISNDPGSAKLADKYAGAKLWQQASPGGG